MFTLTKQSSYPPIYTEEVHQAAENLRLALPLISKHKSPVNPVNYAVWYEYVSGENLALSNAVDALLIANKTISTEASQNLYEKYVLMDMPNRLESTNNGLKLVVDNTLSDINNIESTTNQCLSGFTDSQMALEDCNDLNDLKCLIGNILANTEKMSETSNDLKQSLEQSSHEIAQLKQELEAVKEAAQIDSLTGLLNRGAFNHELNTLCQSTSDNTALILFDLDHFKNINDSFGHLLGDKVIQFFAALLKKYSGEHCFSARYGGEEMALLLFNISQQEAVEIADRIRINFASSRLKKRGHDESIGQVTVSIGISMKNKNDTPSELIERADKALYQSKENGRNQINIA